MPIYKFVDVGYFKKAFGTKGELRLDIKDRYEEDVLKAGALFANQMGTYVPYFVESISDKGSWVLKVEEIDTPEDAKEIASKICYLREMDIDQNRLRVMDTKMDFIVDYDLLDKGNRIGAIQSLEEYPQQLMAIILYREKEILIPLTEEWILEINQDQKFIDMDLPEDFLEVFS